MSASGATGQGQRRKKAAPRVVARQEVPHRKGCYSVAAVKRGDWSTPWAPFAPSDQKAVEWRDRRGTLRSRYAMWLRFRCNDTECPATVLVSGTACCELAPIGTESKRALSGSPL